MKLKTLRLHGFKSFADSTEVDFHDGITAIVGPNGCGKSNIGDAIRWVLGEQRPTAIRGARMEEAIFQGSVHRRPVSRAEVSLIVSNEDKALPVPFEEVELSRIVYRDGGSDYAINRSACRLKDLIDLCRDTGLGANAYAIIEHRMIDALLSDRAEERRALFEEAAGIGRYKDRRKAAHRRLERAELDLQRLDDVIGEVETKVRSLARQKGKAQRYQALRDRRLAVEVAVEGRELAELRGRLEEVERELAGDRELGEGFEAEVKAAEARVEALRLREAEAERERAEAAREVEEVRRELIRWEREAAVAAERVSHARGRMEQVQREEEELGEREAVWLKEEERLRAAQAELARRAGSLREEVEARTAEAARAKEELEAARQRFEELQEKVTELTRRQAHLAGEVEGAEAQAAELSRHHDRLRAQLAASAETLAELEGQGDFFMDQARQLEEEVLAAQTELEQAEEGSRQARAALEAARREEARVWEEVAQLRARVEALEGMERRREGLEPSVRAVLEAGDPGVLGTLSEAFEGEPEVVRAVEAYLGPLVQGLVVEDAAAVRRIRAWYEEHGPREGGLILLPLDQLPVSGRGQGLALSEKIAFRGPGEPWARALLAGVALVDDPLDGEERGFRALLSLSGTVVDRMGVVRIGNPLGSSGILERREEARRLRAELDRAGAVEERLRGERAAAEARVEEAEARVEAARSTLRAAEDRFRESRAEAQAQSEREARLRRHREELARQIEGARAARARAAERAQSAEEEAATLEAEITVVREKETAAREAMASAQRLWEGARSRENELAVEWTRVESELERAEERLRTLQTVRQEAEARREALRGERARLEEEGAAAARLQADGGHALESLFRARDELEERLRDREEAVSRLREAVVEAEREARAARVAEREAVDKRHAQELLRQDLSGRIARIRERLEAEWGRPLEVLLAEAEPVEGEQDALRQELAGIVEKLDKIGPVNMLAVEEHQEESARLEFLLEQRADLQKARDDLRAAIREINETATRLFRETFSEIRRSFRDVFLRLFEGGEADLWLAEEDEPLESPIEIHASPRGKKTQRIDLLSGGERALTALSLLFGIYLVKPSPFCVLDEVDAPLDESNIYRFLRLLDEFKDQTQFIVITHNARTIEAADWIYGVTMEEPGVSRVVGVRLEDALQASGAVA